jgi:hypothetical protein
MGKMGDLLKARYDTKAYGLRYLTVFFSLALLKTDFRVFLCSVHMEAPEMKLFTYWLFSLW